MSDNVKKRIGLGTAYGEAKSKGYTGTQEEFAELMYNITVVGERAEAAKDAAQAAQSAAETAEGNAETAATQAAGSATTASGAASTATQKAGEASTYASNAGASASQAQTYASNAEQSATAASGSASAASGSASAAAGSASAAHTSETNAAESETAAAEAAEQAKEAARTLTIDPTLTQPGQAAEAKATGERLADLKSHLSEIEEPTENLNISGQGRFYANASGVITPSSDYYVGMKDKVPCDASTAYTVAGFDAEISDNKTTVYAVWYDATGTFISRESRVNTPSASLHRTFTSPQNAGYMYFDFYNNTSGIDVNTKIVVVEGETAPSTYIVPYTAIDLTARGMATQNEDRIDDIEETLYGNDYPDYFQSNLDAAVSKIHANMGLVGPNGDSFIFFTDPHWGINEKHSPELIKYLLKKTELRNVVCGGDALDSGTKESELDKGYDFMNCFAFVPGGLKYVVGNHDNNVNQHSGDSSYWLTTEQVYSIFFPKSEMEWKGIRATSGLVSNFRIGAYFDVQATKTRYINVGSPFGTMQSSWINWVKSLIEEDSTANIVLFAHYLYDPTSGFTADAQSLIDMCDAHTNVKAIVFGHIHADLVRYSLSGIPIIATDTDAASRLGSLNPNTATIGTITEQAFDAMTVNYVNRDVCCARVGRGKSRYIRGGVNTVNTGATVTLTSTLSSPTWTSSDNTVATVASGVVSGVASGNCIIKAETADSEEYWCVSVS